jgi:hypothetical protein
VSERRQLDIRVLARTLATKVLIDSERPPSNGTLDIARALLAELVVREEAPDKP